MDSGVMSKLFWLQGQSHLGSKGWCGRGTPGPERSHESLWLRSLVVASGLLMSGLGK